MSDLSKFINDVIAVVHGKPGGSVSADAMKLIDDLEKVGAGLLAAGPYAPAVVGDVAALAAEVAVVVASKGLDVPEIVVAGATLQTLASDLAKAEAAFMGAFAKYKASASVVASAPTPPKTSTAPV